MGNIGARRRLRGNAISLRASASSVLVLNSPRMAAVDHDIRAVDIARLRASQEGDDIGDLLGLAHAARGVLLHHRLENVRAVPLDLLPEAAGEIVGPGLTALTRMPFLPILRDSDFM